MSDLDTIPTDDLVREMVRANEAYKWSPLSVRREVGRRLCVVEAEITRLRTELAEAQSAHATMLREAQTLLAERDTLRQQLAVAREGFQRIANSGQRGWEWQIARDTLAQMGPTGSA